MKFISSKTRENIVNLGRKLGYKKISTKDGELIFVRILSRSGYPRFHLFIKEQVNRISFSLHLDQKRTSYQGSSAHSGEHRSELVEREAQRIKDILKKE